MNKIKSNFKVLIQIGRDGRIFKKVYHFGDLYSQSYLATNEKISAKNVLIGLLGGLFVGFLSGFFGGGGGMIVVPILIFALGLAEKVAHATAIFTILPISIAGSIVYILNGNVPFLELGFTSLGFVFGGVIGAILLKRLNNKFIRILFSLIMIGAGIKIIV